MKFLLTGDWHIRQSRPENRIDNYFDVLMKKLFFLFKHAKANDLPIIQPGDFFDSPNQANHILSLLIENHITFPKIFTIYGQHDLLFRNKENTALDVLNSAKTVHIIKDPYMVSPRINIYGCSFREEIPEITTENKFNILLIHKMIVDDKLWAGQEGHVYAKHLLRKTNFDLIVSGDNHQSFIVDYKDRLLVNCGSLMRSNKDQINHKPIFVIYDTDTREHKVHYIPIEPPENVFNMTKIEQEEQRNENLEAFVQGLSEGQDLGLNFRKNLMDYLKQNEIDKEVIQILKRNMEENHAGNNE